MLHMTSAQCVARDLHTIAPRPLESTCSRQFMAEWGDCKKSRIAPLNVIIIIYYNFSHDFRFKTHRSGCRWIAILQDSIFPKLSNLLFMRLTIQSDITNQSCWRHEILTMAFQCSWEESSLKRRKATVVQYVNNPIAALVFSMWQWQCVMWSCALLRTGQIMWKVIPSGTRVLGQITISVSYSCYWQVKKSCV